VQLRSSPRLNTLAERPEYSATDYAFHRLGVGEDELSAFTADLRLDLETIVMHWEPREIVLREEYRLRLVLRVEYPNMTKQGYKKKNSIPSSPKS